MVFLAWKDLKLRVIQSHTAMREAISEKSQGVSHAEIHLRLTLSRICCCLFLTENSRIMTEKSVERECGEGMNITVVF